MFKHEAFTQQRTRHDLQPATTSQPQARVAMFIGGVYVCPMRPKGGTKGGGGRGGGLPAGAEAVSRSRPGEAATAASSLRPMALMNAHIHSDYCKYISEMISASLSGKPTIPELLNHNQDAGQKTRFGKDHVST